MPSGNYKNVTSLIYTKLYKIVANKLDTRTNQYKNAISTFFNKNNKDIYAIAPYYTIYYNESDKQALFKALDLNEKEVLDILKETFYFNIPYNPGAAKEPYVMVLMCALRYFLIKKRQKEAELTLIYLCFTGKFYASLFNSKGVFPKVAPGKYKTVMDYVVSNMLTDKFDLKKEGTVFGAIRKLCLTWLETYSDNITSDIDDDEIGKLIQQLRTREMNFLHNIAKKYYEAYENRNYLNADNENLDQQLGEFRLTENDSLRAARISQNTLMYLITNAVSLTLCNNCKDENIRSIEIQGIMESILGNQENNGDIHRIINILICDFIKRYPKKHINSAEFFAYSRMPKPNTQDAYLLDLKRIILGWLDENSENYRRRKGRRNTAASYYNAVLTYFILSIMKCAKNE